MIGISGSVASGGVAGNAGRFESTVAAFGSETKSKHDEGEAVRRGRRRRSSSWPSVWDRENGIRAIGDGELSSEHHQKCATDGEREREEMGREALVEFQSDGAFNFRFAITNEMGKY